MPLQTLIGPAAQPIDVIEARNHVRQDLTADDTVLEQFQFQAGSQGALETAMIGMCRVYPEATVIAEQLSTHERLRERCKRSFASMLSAS